MNLKKGMDYYIQYQYFRVDQYEKDCKNLLNIAKVEHLNGNRGSVLLKLKKNRLLKVEINRLISCILTIEEYILTKEYPICNNYFAAFKDKNSEASREEIKQSLEDLKHQEEIYYKIMSLSFEAITDVDLVEEDYEEEIQYFCEESESKNLTSKVNTTSRELTEQDELELDRLKAMMGI